jgi:predicted ATPase
MTSSPAAIVLALTFLKQHRCFDSGHEIQFRPGVNLLVGELGSGKSTGFGRLRGFGAQSAHEAKAARETVTLALNPEIAQPRVYSFDFEKENKRTLSHFGDDIGFQIQSMFSSHGESVNAMLRAIENDPSTHTLLLLDEPDMALSPRSAHRLAKILQSFAEQGNQVIASVHNPLLMLSQAHVLSLEHGRWMEPSEFLAAHAEEPAQAPKAKSRKKPAKTAAKKR